MAATRKLDQSDLMIRAGAQGEAAVQRSQESRTGNRQQTLSRKESARQFNKSIEQQELDRSQRQWEVLRADRANRDAVRAKNQAEKKDMTIFGQQGRKQREAEANYKAESVSDREKFTETKRQFDESQGLDAAKHGLRKASPATSGQANPSFADHAPTSQTPRDIVKAPSTGDGQDQYVTAGSDVDQTGAQASLDPRAQQLQQEMDQRGQVQMGSPLELGTQGSGWVADPSTPAAQTAVAKAQSAQLAVIRERHNLGMKMQEAQAKVNLAATKEAKALLKETEVKAQARIANFTDRFTKFDDSQGLTDEGPSKSDWEKIGELAKGKDFLPPEIHQAIADRKANARLVGWLDEKRARMAIEYVAAGSGELPDREYFDFLTEGMKEFTNEVQAAREENKYKFGGPVGLFSTATRAKQRRIVYKMAATAILDKRTMTQGPAGGAAGGEPAAPGAEGQPALPDAARKSVPGQVIGQENRGYGGAQSLGPAPEPGQPAWQVTD